MKGIFSSEALSAPQPHSCLKGTIPELKLKGAFVWHLLVTQFKVSYLLKRWYTEYYDLEDLIGASF